MVRHNVKQIIIDKKFMKINDFQVVSITLTVKFDYRFLLFSTRYSKINYRIRVSNSQCYWNYPICL